MKRVLEIGVVLVAVSSLLGVALEPCCTSERACSGAEEPAPQDASMDAHCADPAPLAVSARCCGLAKVAGPDYVIGATAQLGALGPAALGAPTAITRQAPAPPIRRSPPPASPHRSPVLRL